MISESPLSSNYQDDKFGDYIDRLTFNLKKAQTIMKNKENLDYTLFTEIMDDVSIVFYNDSEDYDTTHIKNEKFLEQAFFLFLTYRRVYLYDKII